MIYLFFIFGFISCSQDPTRAFDIWYNYNYNLQKDIYLDFTFYVFRLPVNYVGKMDMEVKVHVNDPKDFGIRVFQYNYEATLENILNFDGYAEEKYTIGEMYPYPEGDYEVYSYPFQSSLGGKYFGIQLTIPNYSYNYIYFRVNSAKYQYSNVKELRLNEEYEIDTKIFGDQLVPTGYQIFIRIASFSEDKMEVQLSTHKVYNKDTAFQVDVCQYDSMPTESQVYYGDPDKICNRRINNISKDDKKFRYPFSTEKEINYLSIRIINKEQDLGYLKIFIYSEKGMAIALLVLVIVLPVLVVGGIVYLILKKLGICK